MQAYKTNRPLFRHPSLQKEFDENGYVIVDFLDTGEVKALKEIYEHVPGDLGKPAFASSIMSRDAQYRVRLSSAIEEAFRQPLNKLCNDTRIFWGNYNIKCPNHRNGIVPLHQDPSFLDERQYTAMGIWVPLVDTTHENGALEVIPHSHTLLRQPRCGGRPFPYTSSQHDLLHQFGKSLLMRAGQAYIGNPALFHASPTNRSDETRIAAAGLAGAIECSLRYFHYVQRDEANFAEMFEVDRDYYVTQPLFSRPSTDIYRIAEYLPLDECPPATETIFSFLRDKNNKNAESRGDK